MCQNLVFTGIYLFITVKRDDLALTSDCLGKGELFPTCPICKIRPMLNKNLSPVKKSTPLMNNYYLVKMTTYFKFCPFLGMAIYGELLLQETENLKDTCFTKKM